MKVVTLPLTAIIGGIIHKQCRWLPLRVWWHVLAFVTHEITWRRAYIASFSPPPWKIFVTSRKNRHGHVIIQYIARYFGSGAGGPHCIIRQSSLNFLLACKRYCLFESITIIAKCMQCRESWLWDMTMYGCYNHLLLWFSTNRLDPCASLLLQWHWDNHTIIRFDSSSLSAAYMRQ